MTRAILTLNFGSSSIKFGLYSHEKNPKLLCKRVDKLVNFETALHDLLQPSIQLVAAGHRIVHGGERYTKSVLINESVLQYLDTLSALAPLHQPHNLAGIRALQVLYPKLPQIACFDTAFHHTLPRLATLFALPQSFWDDGVRRYGFHGLSYSYIAGALHTLIGPRANDRTVIAHLGHGASMCGLKNLASIATTMGLTALDGLPMGTRCGSIDPGAILYLMADKGYSIQAMTDLLYNKSGLLGLSGISADVRELLNLKNPQAREAIDYFCYSIQRELGSLVATIGGLDTFVFTGGIGENAATIRAQVCEGLKWLNVELDDNRNAEHPISVARQISTPNSQVSVWVIPTDEEIIIARDAFKLS